MPSGYYSLRRVERIFLYFTMRGVSVCFFTSAAVGLSRGCVCDAVTDGNEKRACVAGSRALVIPGRLHRGSRAGVSGVVGAIRVWGSTKVWGEYCGVQDSDGTVGEFSSARAWTPVAARSFCF